MSDNWVQLRRRELIEICKYCRECADKGKDKDASVLEAFSLYLLRILNSLAQMQGNNTYGYENQILSEPMRLFCIYYIEQVHEALDQQSDERKSGIIIDLEEAISKISNVYKNVIDSTSNSDRQLFTSPVVETSVYDISPKLFAVYSKILETLVALFDKQDIYGFLLHPSMKSNVETVSLFNARQQMGKVVLIYIPENKIERVQQIPFFLLHEAFHVLTKEERCRKDRACRLEGHMYNGISQRLFRNVSFDYVVDESNEDSIDVVIKNELMKRWFDTEKWISEFRDMADDDRRLYSGKVIAKIRKDWIDALKDMLSTLCRDLCQVLAGRNVQRDRNLYNELMKTEWEIQKNLLEILANNKVEQYATMYMQFYREAYSDIASVLTAGISPDIYENAFQESQVDQAKNLFENDILREIRIYIVANTIAKYGRTAYVQEWKEYRDKHNIREQSKLNSDGIQISNDIWIREIDLNAFESILKKCGDKLWERLGSGNEFSERFRQILKELEMLNILSGKTNQELSELKVLLNEKLNQKGK